MSPRRAVTALLCFCLASAASSRAELFLSPELVEKVGYTSNRTLEPGGPDSPYLLTQPALELNWFGTGTTELAATLRHTRVDYSESGMSGSRRTAVEAGLRGPRRATRWEIELSGGNFEDRELPEDDLWWVGAAGTLSRDVGTAGNGSLTLSGVHNRFDSRRTESGDEQRETLWGLTPAFSWTPSDRAVLWAQGTLAANVSNESQEDWWSLGATLGGDWIVGHGLRIGAWAAAQHREYQDPDAAGEDRSDTPLSAGAWGALRLAPWIELTLGGQWTDQRSSATASDYSVWSVEGGVRVVYDWQP